MRSEIPFLALIAGICFGKLLGFAEASGGDHASPPSILAVVNRYHEDIGWLHPNGTLLVPTVVYQKANIYKGTGLPVFPGYKLFDNDTKQNEIAGWPEWLLDVAPQIREVASKAERQLLKQGKNVTSEIVLETISPILPLHITPNRGAESVAYISAILDHWDTMADIMIFIHAHRTSWHTVIGQDWALNRLAYHAPNLTGVGYVPINCLEEDYYPLSALELDNYDANVIIQKGTPHRWRETLLARFRQAWREVSGHWLGEKLPTKVEVPCCASFVTTSKAIKSRPREFYEAFRLWLLGDMDPKWAGIAAEMHWGLILTGNPILKWPQEECMCTLFNVCNHIDDRTILY